MQIYDGWEGETHGLKDYVDSQVNDLNKLPDIISSLIVKLTEKGLLNDENLRYILDNAYLELKD